MISRLLAQHCANLARHLANKPKVNLLAGKRRADCDQGEFGLKHGFAKVGGCLQVSTDVLAQERFESTLKNGRSSLLDEGYFLCIRIHTNNVMPFLGETY